MCIPKERKQWKIKLYTYHLKKVMEDLQCTHTRAIIGTPIEPTSIPAFLNASGIAKIPVPIFPLSRWTIVSQFLIPATKIFKK